MRRTIETVLWGGALFTAIQLPGAMFDAALRHDVRFAVRLVVVLIVVALVLRVLRSTWPRGWRAAGAAGVAAVLAVAAAQIEAAKLGDKVVEVPDLGILVPAPNRRYTDCRGRPPRCHEHVINELGFRGTLGRRPTPDARLVAFVGDSHVFGSGVGDGDTVPALLAGALADLRPPVAVVNAGIQGLSAGSFADIVRYLRARLSPDLFVVLLKDDDLDETDVLSRWDRFRRSLWFRMLYAMSWETIVETARQYRQRWFGGDGRGDLLVRQLDALAEAAQGATLLIIADLTEDLRPVLSAWLASHPDVGYLNAWDDPRYWQAERIPFDGHWTEAGARTIADLVAPVVRAQLAASR